MVSRFFLLPRPTNTTFMTYILSDDFNELLVIILFHTFNFKDREQLISTAITSTAHVGVPVVA